MIYDKRNVVKLNSETKPLMSNLFFNYKDSTEIYFSSMPMLRWGGSGERKAKQIASQGIVSLYLI